jgi:hypothetical protein
VCLDGQTLYKCRLEHHKKKLTPFIFKEICPISVCKQFLAAIIFKSQVVRYFGICSLKNVFISIHNQIYPNSNPREKNMRFCLCMDYFIVENIICQKIFGKFKINPYILKQNSTYNWYEWKNIYENSQVLASKAIGLNELHDKTIVDCDKEMNDRWLDDNVYFS